MFEDQKLPLYLTQDEVTALFSKIRSKRDRALFDLIYKYGLRVALATCRPGDVSVHQWI